MGFNGSRVVILQWYVMDIKKQPTIAQLEEYKRRKGRVSWNKGIPMSESAKLKLSESKVGRNGWNKGIPMSDMAKLKSSISHTKSIGFWKDKKRPNMTGESHPRWKGGYENVLFQNRQRKFRKNHNGGSHTLREWKDLKEKYNFTCPCCYKSEPNIKLTEDHIIPLIKGGGNSIDNIQPLCHSCNSKKGEKEIIYIIKCGIKGDI